MVTIHGLFEIRFWFVVLARKKQVLISNKACEAVTPHTAYSFPRVEKREARYNEKGSSDGKVFSEPE